MFQHGKKPQNQTPNKTYPLSTSTINIPFKSQSLHTNAARKSSRACGSTESSDFKAEDIYFSSSGFLKLTTVHSFVNKT